MTISIQYPSGHVRTHVKLTQRDVNRIITHVSELQDQIGELAIRITVTDGDK